MQVAPGDYHFALGSDTGDRLSGGTNVEVRTDLELTGEFQSRRGARIAGGLVLALGVAAGLGVLGDAMRDRREARQADHFCPVDLFPCDDEVDDDTKPRIVIGALTTVVSAVVGLVLVTRKDRVVFRARALRGGAGAGERTAADEPSAAPEPPGSDEEALQSLRPRVIQCWPTPASATAVSIEVWPDGRVGHAKVSSAVPPPLRRCVEDVLRRAVFPQGQSRTLNHVF